ncbi:GxxExxY protein [Persicobacter sp. CCB-QB2]|uniref:GxxExxY protein n=1 Tax=Persicobacter sp. CCB-QB2 TaxID=1561025 RepID=UPI0006A9C701|nr:GxxExxY protein [Persicobacter sp. CCB-QB2]
MALKFKEEYYLIVGAAMKVHQYFGNGFLEAVYQEALMLEFEKQRIPFRREVSLPLYYHDVQMTKYYVADFILYDRILLELKAVKAIDQSHEAQIINYLKITKAPLGVLLNFGARSLQHKRYLMGK